MKAVMVMFDTLSRRFLSTYGNTWVKTPNFERLQEHCTQFDQFYVGSLPCMPARRELHTGRYNFLHRGWGPLEPFDDSVIELLKKHNIYTHIVSDHNHYWEDGGATYVTRYSSWEGFRGQEGDHWVGIVDKEKVVIPKQVKTSRKGAIIDTCYANKTRIQKEEEFSSVKTIQAGIQFMEENIGSDNWFLQIECFDPHEPFHVPQRFLDMYESIPSEPVFDWPTYAPVCETEEEKRQVIVRYAALITMCDEYLGKILDVMDKHDMWQDTMFMVNTDHGFLMGEHNWWGKSIQPVYQEIAHTPYYLHIPHMHKDYSHQMAQTIDIAPTLLDYFDIEKPDSMLGHSMIPVIKDDKAIHDAILFGYFGGHVNIFDGTYLYMRSPLNKDNSPLYEYTLMPTRMKGFIESDILTKSTLSNEFDFTHGMNVLRIPTHQPSHAYFFGNKLFDMKNDYNQMNNLDDVDIEVTMIEKMRYLLLENEAPDEQYKRLGIIKKYSMAKSEILLQRETRKQNDTIIVNFKLTKEIEAKLRLIKSLLPMPLYEQFILQVEKKSKNEQNIDLIIKEMTDQVTKQSNIPESISQIFSSFIEKAYEIE